MVVISFSAVPGWESWKAHRFANAWKQIVPDDTEERLLAVLGKPGDIYVQDRKEINRETVKKGYDFVIGGREIAKNFKYYRFLDRYYVFFDSNNRVVAKSHPPLTFSE
jgi:hypothetical protein